MSDQLDLLKLIHDALAPVGTKSEKLNIGKLGSPRHIAIEKIRAGLEREGLVTNNAMVAHVIQYYENQSLSIDSLADENASDTIVDLLISAYVRRS